MGAAVHLEQPWWSAVLSIAAYYREMQGFGEISEAEIRQMLKDESFPSEDIAAAFAWLDMAALNGNLMESLAMLEPPPAALGLHNSFESAFLSQKMRSRIEVCRLQGIFGNDVVENVIEGLRAFDVREMNEKELSGLVAELLSVVVPSTTKKEFLRILRGDVRRFDA